MASAPLYILLCSGEHEKVQMAAMLASVGAVSERPVEVFVSMNAILAFETGKSRDERCRGGAYSALLKENHAPDAITLFGQGKELGDLKMWACSSRPGVMSALASVPEARIGVGNQKSPGLIAEVTECASPSPHRTRHGSPN